jgi:short-subunit dehydrogenase
MGSFFNNKVVAITGGSDGIGKALIEALIPMGAKVATCGRNQDKLYNLQVKFSGSPLHTVVADVSNYGDCKQFIESTLDTFGHIDILINNAGVSKLALPSILQQKGTIVGVSSIAGYRGLPGRSGYSASKFAVNGWLEAVRTELLHTGSNVMWVCPGFTSSNIRNAALNSQGGSHGETPMDEDKLMSAETCAAHILRAIEKRKRSLVLTFTGKRTVLLNRFFPRWADKLVHKFFFQNGQLVK